MKMLHSTVMLVAILICLILNVINTLNNTGEVMMAYFLNVFMNISVGSIVVWQFLIN